MLERIKSKYIERLNTLNFAGSFTRNFPGTKTFNVLSIGCGSTPLEADALTDFFSTHQLNIDYLGIDIDTDDIATCTNKNKKANIRFKTLDITKYEDIREEFKSEPIHMIIARHPMLTLNDPATRFFTYAFMTTVPYLLAPGGTLIATLYHEEESKEFKTLIESVSTSPTIELAECKDNFLTNDSIECYLGSVVKPLYADRFFQASVNFTPHEATEQEKRALNQPTSIYRQKLKEILYAALKKSNYAHEIFAAILQQAIIHISDKINSDGKLSAEQVIQTVDNVIKNTCSQEPILNSTIGRLPWAIYDRSLDLCNDKVNDIFEAISATLLNNAIQITQLNYQDLCQRGLKLITLRPMLQDLFPKQTTQQDHSARETNFVSYGGLI